MGKRKFEVLNSQLSRITKVPRPTIDLLPKDLLIEILAKVAANSCTDLFNASLVAKNFLQASEEGYIFQQMSLQNFQKVPWENADKFSSFMEKCTNNGNLEALYRKGILDFFTHGNEACGLASLRASAEKGYTEALYVYGVVLYCANLKEEGMTFLKRCEAKLGVKMFECRQRVRDSLRYIWIINKIYFSENDLDERKSCDCVKYYNRNRWDWNDQYDHYGPQMCEACKWNGEVRRFCNMLRTGSYD